MFFIIHGRRHKQSGYTLVEIMVAMVITLIVMGGVYNTFTRETVNTEKEQMRIDMQMSGRVILDLISRDIRAAGFEGCKGTLAANTLSNVGSSPSDVLQTYTDTGTAAFLPILTTMKGAAGIQYLGMPFAYVNNDSVGTNIYRDGTDVLTLRYVSEETRLSTAMTASTVDLQLTNKSFNQEDILVVSDCEHYSIFQKTNSKNTYVLKHKIAGLNTSSSLSHAYDTNAKVYKLKINTYFIDNETLDLSLNNKSSDIAENVEDLQFQYMYDTDNDNNLTDEAWADTVAAGFTTNDVAAIRIFVLLRSDLEATGYTNTENYDYPNSPYYSVTNPFGSANGVGGAPDDGYYRSLLSNIVYLRNYNL